MLEGTPDEVAKPRFEDHELLQQFQEVEKLPEEDKAMAKNFLGAFLFKRQVEQMAAGR